MSNLIIIGPKNIEDVQFDFLFQLIYKKVLEKNGINKPKDLHMLPVSFFATKDFKKRTTRNGFLNHIKKYFAFQIVDEEKINSTKQKEWSRNKIKFSSNDFYFLNEKEMIVLKERIIKGKTLVEVSKSEKLGISRERVRQIESVILNYFRLLSLPNFVERVNDIFGEKQMVCKEDILELFDDNDAASIFNHYCSVQNNIYGIKYSQTHSLYYKNNGMSPILIEETMKSNLKNHGMAIYSKNQLKKMVFNNEENSDDLIECILKEKTIFEKKNGFYFLIPKSKSFVIEIFVALKKNGYIIKKEFDELVSFCKEYSNIFKSDEKMEKNAFSVLLEHNHRIILWGWGVYAHIQNIYRSFKIPTFEIEDFISKKLKDTGMISAELIYEEFKDLCNEYEIPNHNALYSVLRTKLDDKFYFNHCPWIKKEEDDDVVIDVVIKYMIENNKETIRVSEVVEKFGVSKVRAAQILAYSKKMEQTGKSGEYKII